MEVKKQLGAFLPPCVCFVAMCQKQRVKKNHDISDPEDCNTKLIKEYVA